MSKHASYTPINCEVHDGYELACMRHSSHDVVWVIEGEVHRARLRFLDLIIDNGAEYLLGEDTQGDTLRIRLDQITSSLPY